MIERWLPSNLSYQ